jgi:hypothetical protein
MISDDMIHGCWVGLRRPAHKQSRGCGPAGATTDRAGGKPVGCATEARIERAPSGIEADTPVVPRAVAQAVHEEVSVWLETPLPRQWIDELCGHAETIYPRNPQFRRGVRRAGNRGRDYLWAFTRHWLAARVREWNSNLFSRLPNSYAIGNELPQGEG